VARRRPPVSIIPHAAILAAASVALLALAGCATARGPTLSQSSAPRESITFDYRATDGSVFSSETTHGRVTLIVFITTYDLPSQLLLRRVGHLQHEKDRRFNVGAVVLEPPKNAPLVETFRETLELTYPVALADPPTLESRGPFGAIEGVPTLVVLDPAGAVTFRQTGVPAEADIRKAIERAWRAAP
jgi:hypothetical protein